MSKNKCNFNANEILTINANAILKINSTRYFNANAILATDAISNNNNMKKVLM